MEAESLSRAVPLVHARVGITIPHPGLWVGWPSIYILYIVNWYPRSMTQMYRNCDRPPAGDILPEQVGDEHDQHDPRRDNIVLSRIIVRIRHVGSDQLAQPHNSPLESVST